MSLLRSLELSAGRDDSSLTGRLELSQSAARKLSPWLRKVEPQVGVGEAHLDERTDAKRVAATDVCALRYACIAALVTDVHGVVRVVRTTEFVWRALVGPDGERVRGSALVLQVVAVEPESAPRVLVEEHGEIPGAQSGVRVARSDSGSHTGCGCEHRCPLRTAEVVLEGGRVLLVLLDTVERNLSPEVVDDIHRRRCLSVRSVLLGVVVAVVAVVVEDVVGVRGSRVLRETDAA